MPTDPDDLPEFDDDADDHAVPAELIELSEVIEWQAAVDEAGAS